MKYNKLRDLIFKHPFKPLRLTVDSGESVVVRHPENIMITLNWVVVANKESLFYTEPEKITSVTTLRSANGNGSR